jgi:hypothetical protein
MDFEHPVDTPTAMISDLRTILDGWEFEPGKISVRKIIGRDGREKIQTRIDLGVLQLECAGRPDGERPWDCESLLEYHEQRLQKHVALNGNDEDFILSPEDCRDLRHEAYLYYQRYLSQFVLEEFSGVERDTARNLRVIELCERYAACETDRTLLGPQRPYVLMMNTRARAQAAAARMEPDLALQIVDMGLAEIERQRDSEDEPECSSELGTLRTLRREIIGGLPEHAPARLQSELDMALAIEDYEHAAELRDRLSRPGSDPR